MIFLGFFAGGALLGFVGVFAFLAAIALLGSVFLLLRAVLRLLFGRRLNPCENINLA